MKTINSISISFQETLAQARALSDCADMVRTVQRQMAGVQEDLRGNWSGEAAEQYLRKCETLNARLKHAAGELDQIEAAITKTAKAYFEAEKRAIRLAQTRKK